MLGASLSHAKAWSPDDLHRTAKRLGDRGSGSWARGSIATRHNSVNLNSVCLSGTPGGTHLDKVSNVRTLTKQRLELKHL